jgi:DNA-binding response OmpR family regulator
MAKVLIAEDDVLIAEMLQIAVAEGGYEVCGIATDPDQVVALGERARPDLAIIDVRLDRGTDGVMAAIRLSQRMKVGILYASGNCHELIEHPPPVGEACLSKPFTIAELVSALQIVEEITRSGTVSLPIPWQLRLLNREGDPGRRGLGGVTLP